MYTMPSEENFNRLRLKQQEAVSKVYDQPFGKFLFKLPGGYGKQKAAVASYVAARAAGSVNRLLIIAPSRQQRDEWIECQKDFDFIGADVSTFSVSGVNHVATPLSNDKAFDRCKKGLCEVFVTTIQSLCSSSSPGSEKNVAELLMSVPETSWCVVAEEAHHYAENMQWGGAIAQLNAKLLIGLSATPFRSKGRHIFSELLDGQYKDRVVECTIREAISEQAIRRTTVITGSYQVDFMSKKNDEIYSFKLSELKDYLGDLELTDFEAKMDLRVLDQFVRPIFVTALNQLDNLNYLHPGAMGEGEHQMIVHAPSCLTAQCYCNWIRLLVDSTVTTVDWVGTDRPDEENRNIIKAFKNNNLKILVQVQMFGEGSDNPRASVGVWLSLIGSNNPTCHQGLVRHSRRNTRIPWDSDIAYIFIPEDSPGLEEALAIQSESDYYRDLSLSEGNGVGAGETNLKSLDDLLAARSKAIDAELRDLLDGSDYKRKIAEAKEVLEGLRPEIVQTFLGAVKPDGSALTLEEAEKKADVLLETRVDQVVMQSIERKISYISEEQQWKEANSRVESAVKSIARKIAARHHGKTGFEQSTFSAIVGSVKRKLNGKVKDTIGASRGRKNGDTPRMSVDQLNSAYNKLYEIDQRVNAGDIPTELML